MLRPEDSMRIQHSIGADIMMWVQEVVTDCLSHTHPQPVNRQLDDVVASLTEPVRMQEASERSVRCEARMKATRRVLLTDVPCLLGLDRCIEAHEAEGHHQKQNLFAIIQGRCLSLAITGSIARLTGL